MRATRRPRPRATAAAVRRDSRSEPLGSNGAAAQVASSRYSGDNECDNLTTFVRQQHTRPSSPNSHQTITRAGDWGKVWVKIGKDAAGEVMAVLTLTFLGSFQAAIDSVPISR